MSHPATLPPSLLPLQLDPFVEQSQRGLFAAPWLDRPTPSEVFAVQRLTRTLSHNVVSTDTHGDLAPVLSLLLLIRSHCMLAAIATDAREARQHYNEALKVCLTTLNLLHHETEGTPLAIASWVQGVHSLIWAQLAVPNFPEVERLCRMAMVQLSGVTDPVCRGAEADAHAATRLAHEPPELARALSELPDRIAAKEEYYRYQLDQQESLLNQRLAGIHVAYTEAFRLATGWGALNLALMAPAPERLLAARHSLERPLCDPGPHSLVGDLGPAIPGRTALLRLAALVPAGGDGPVHDGSTGLDVPGGTLSGGGHRVAASGPYPAGRTAQLPPPRPSARVQPA